MIGCDECKRMSRRTFLKRSAQGAGALALADPLLHTVAQTYGQSSGGTGNLLVLCQLNGGLDALSVLAPFTNTTYHSKRPQLGLNPGEVTVLPDNSSYGINNQLSTFAQLYTAGQGAIIQQVGYPDANGSHFESQEIYEYGVRHLGKSSDTWYERLRRTYFNEPFGVLDTKTIGDPTRYGYPDTTSEQGAKDAFGRLARMRTGRTPAQQAILDTYRRIDEIGNEIRERTEDFTSTGASRGEFYRAAQLASANLNTQIIKLQYYGFDTHGSQDSVQANVFGRLNDDFNQFIADIQMLGMWDRTAILFYSEFGRRNTENGSPGTDHGQGGHMYLFGPSVNGGLHGQNVTTADLNQSSLPYYVDFRAVLSTVVRDWLGFNPDPIFRLGGEDFNGDVGSGLFV